MRNHTLTKRQALIVKLREIDKLTYGQIGEIIGIKGISVAQAYAKATRKIEQPNSTIWIGNRERMMMEHLCQVFNLEKTRPAIRQLIAGKTWENFLPHLKRWGWGPRTFRNLKSWAERPGGDPEPQYEAMIESCRMKPKTTSKNPTP